MDLIAAYSAPRWPRHNYQSIASASALAGLVIKRKHFEAWAKFASTLDAVVHPASARSRQVRRLRGLGLVAIWFGNHASLGHASLCAGTACFGVVGLCEEVSVSEEVCVSARTPVDVPCLISVPLWMQGGAVDLRAWQQKIVFPLPLSHQRGMLSPTNNDITRRSCSRLQS